MMIDPADEIREDYCGDCGCVADDEICPRCRAEIADAMRRNEFLYGDRRWNGEPMSRRHCGVDHTILINVREFPSYLKSQRIP